MAKRKNRVILDTNLWISLLLTKDYKKFDRIIDNTEITLVFSEELLQELIDVSQRKKFKKYFDPTDIYTLLALIQRRADFITVVSETKICRDPKDNFLLALAIDGSASHLITGDSDLLVLEKFEDTVILTMTDYLDI